MHQPFDHVIEVYPGNDEQIQICSVKRLVFLSEISALVALQEVAKRSYFV